MTGDTGRKPPRRRETQAEFFSRITDGIDAIRDLPRLDKQGFGGIPAPTALMNCMAIQRIAEGQNRALKKFLEHCEAGGQGYFAIGDLPDADIRSGLGFALQALREAVEVNHRLRDLLGERIVSKGISKSHDFNSVPIFPGSANSNSEIDNRNETWDRSKEPD